MLMLGRKSGQKVLLKTSDGLIKIMFKEFANGNAYIGFEAPKSVNIVREELVKPNVNDKEIKNTHLKNDGTSKLL